jgi:hypothetical protein
MTFVRTLTVTIIAASVLLLAIGCVSPAGPLATEPDFNGFITDVNTIDNKDVIGSVAVESHADKLLEKYVITVTTDTALFQQVGDDFQAISFDDLEVKQWLQIWFDGPVMESWPMQAKALQIVIIP